MPEKRYLTPQEAAELLGISLRTMKRHLANGVIPAKKIGRFWRIRLADLDALLDPSSSPRPPRRRPGRPKGGTSGNRPTPTR